MPLILTPRHLTRGGYAVAVLLAALAVAVAIDLIKRHQSAMTKVPSVYLPAGPNPPGPSAKQISAWISGLASGVRAIRIYCIRRPMVQMDWRFVGKIGLFNPDSSFDDVSFDAEQSIAAQKHLLAAGDAVVPALKRTLDGSTTPSIRMMLRQTRRAIALADALRGPLVSLHLKKATLRTVFTRLYGQAGMVPDFYPFSRNLGPGPRYFDQKTLTINVQCRPFWKVLRQIAKATGVGPNTDGSFSPARPIRDRFQGPGVFQKGSTIDICGAFLVVWRWPGPPALRQMPMPPWGGPRLMRPGAWHGLRLGPQQHQSLLRPQITVLWCPDGNKITEFGPLELTQAMANTGESLLVPVPPDTPRRPYWNADGNGSGQRIVFNSRALLKRPAAQAKTIAVLRGKLPMVLSFAPRTYRVKNLAAGNAFLDIKGIRLKFGKPIDTTGHGPIPHGWVWKVPVTIDPWVLDRRTIPLFLAMERQLSQSRGVEFYGAGGVKLGQPSCAAATRPGPHYHYALEITHAKPVAVSVRVYRYPATRVEIPFEFKNVPLPR